MKTVSIILTVVTIISACTRPTPTEQAIRNAINSPLSIGMFEVVQRGDSVITMEEFREQFSHISVVYLRDGCSPCYPKFIEWQQKMDSIGSPPNHTVLFVIQGRSYQQFMEEVHRIEPVLDKYYHVMDPRFRYVDGNKDIPEWILETSVLIDAESRIRMVGAPFINSDIKGLFGRLLAFRP